MARQTDVHRYEGKADVVLYDAKRCIHAAECVHGLPAAFDPNAKPWVNPDGADPAELASVVDRCPSGALKLERAEGTPASVPALNTATLTPHGPTHLRGDLALMAQDDSVALRDTRMALCRCGASRNKPFCDRSHAKAGFQDAGALRASEAPPEAAGGGPLAIRARPDGPLVLTGPLTVIGTNGRRSCQETTFLCRCGASGNKPYCDGTHKKIGFAG